MIRSLVFVFGFACLLCSACSAPTERVVPLPKLPDGQIQLRVAYAVNPRLPQMSAAQLQTLLDAMRQASREHFGVVIEFAPLEIVPIEQLFNGIPDDVRTERSKWIYDFRASADLSALETAFGRELKTDGEPLQEMIDFSRPYIGNIREASYEALGSALAKYHLATLEHWRRIPALDQQPSIDRQPFNEYALWSAIGYGKVPYELILTNQLIASVETLHPAVHSAIRGGYANGITVYSKDGRFGSLSIWSTFAFTANDAWTKQLRENETYEPEEAARLAGLAATHELGHQLWHLLHPYAQTQCIMSPVPVLAFRRWAQGLSAKACPLGSNPAMTPGAYRFYY